MDAPDVVGMANDCLGAPVAAWKLAVLDTLDMVGPGARDRIKNVIDVLGVAVEDDDDL